MIVQAAPPAHYDWIVERTSCAVTNGFRAIEAVDAAGRIVAMVGYDLWTPNSVQMHVALDHPAALRHVLRPAFAYPFLQCGKAMVHAVIPSDNKRSCMLVQRVGFRKVCRVRDGWSDGVDMILHEMRRHECRWIGDAHGQKLAA